MKTELFSDERYVESPVDPSLLGDGWECDRAASFFAAKRPSEVTAEMFERDFPGDWASCHYLLTDDAFLHFLPALLRIAEETRAKPNAALEYAAMLGDSLRTTLARMARGEMQERLNAVLGAYSPDQVAEVARFFMDEVHWEGSEDFEGNKAGLEFWGKLASRGRCATE
jgi:hypothetical protein